MTGGPVQLAFELRPVGLVSQTLLCGFLVSADASGLKEESASSITSERRIANWFKTAIHGRGAAEMFSTVEIGV